MDQRNQAFDELAKYTAYTGLLERENAELRKKLDESQHSDGFSKTHLDE